ncbi:Nucleoid-associated protein YbaB [bacterium HR28]|nr:Nucleoid-associated protein YbaB [bacterium HR28]
MQPNLRLLKQVQEQLAKVQAELSELVVEGSAGGGAVRVEVDGLRHVRRVRLDPAVVQTGDTEMLEDLIAAAVNDALRRVDEAVTAKVGALAGGLGLPFPSGSL